MKRIFPPATSLLLAALLSWAPACLGQSARGKRQAADMANTFSDNPKLIVGIVVDQMRFDYLSRFWDHYGDGGFKRLVARGFLARNHHFNYVPTSTGPGHASVYTGTTPSVHGIIGNDWYDKATGQEVYCAGDSTVQSVGSLMDVGRNSPHRMLTTTITDQLRLHYQMRSKVIAVALKDRGAVLPAGHTGNAAYWFEGGQHGKWISSTYYMDSLPGWVNDFNASGAAEKYRRNWEPLKDINTYLESGPDNVPYEGIIDGEVAPVFPHKLPELWDGNGRYGLLRITPFGNSLTTDFALKALQAEKLGEDAVTDFLAISYSSTDYVGHWYGVNSKEIQDTYLRLDADLERLLKELDRSVGEGEYTVFLTADHGAVHVPAYLADSKIPAGYLDMSGSRQRLSEFLEYTFGTTDIVKNFSNGQLFLDHDLAASLDLDLGEVQRLLADELMDYPGVARVYTARQMQGSNYTAGVAMLLQNGYNHKRSGDVLIVTRAQFASYSRTGSTHGSPHIYDTHVPLILFGKGIRPGSLRRRTVIPDIAPTIASLLGIAFPTGTTGAPIAEALD